MAQAYQTIVIGAGSSGLNAARFLKDKTLVLDKKSEIGIPIQCGEGISIHALNRERIDLQTHWISRYITHIKRIMPNGKYIGERQKDPYAVVLNKSDFEKYLADLVKWEIRLNTRVVELKREGRLWVIQTQKGDRLYTKHVIGADGPNSLVARQVFKTKHHLIPAINYSANFEKPIPNDELHMYFGNRIAPSGYGWFFPLSKKSANVGMLIKHKGRVKDYFNHFIETTLKPLFGNFQLAENKSGVLPVDGFAESITKKQAFLVGDAGAFTDPIFGGGINMALLTGRLSAESINADNPKYYQIKINELPFTRQDLRESRKIFYSLDDTTLNELGDIFNGRSTSFLNTKDGQKAFQSKPNLVKHQPAIAQFVKTWQSAKPYIW